MTNRIRTGIALLMLSHGLVGCGDQGSPTAPSAPPPPAVQQPEPSTHRNSTEHNGHRTSGRFDARRRMGNDYWR